MEQKKMVERKSAGRMTEVYPTDKSRKLDGKIKEAWRNLYNRYSEIIEEEEAKRLTASIYDAVKKLR
jgi:predicted transcriptional regulator